MPACIDNINRVSNICTRYSCKKTRKFRVVKSRVLATIKQTYLHNTRRWCTRNQEKSFKTTDQLPKQLGAKYKL